MKHYDSEFAPDPSEWLAFDEQQRIHLAEAHHRAARIKVPNVKVRAAFHAIVENQFAETHAPSVRAMTRLRQECPPRHDALYAIGSVATNHFIAAMDTKDVTFAPTAQARYGAAVERLSAKACRRRKSD